MDDMYEARKRLEKYIKSGGENTSNFINGVHYITPDKIYPRDLYKMIMDEIDKNSPRN